MYKVMFFSYLASISYFFLTVKGMFYSFQKNIFFVPGRQRGRAAFTIGAIKWIWQENIKWAMAS